MNCLSRDDNGLGIESVFMNSDERRRQLESFLLSMGWDADQARDAAIEAVDDNKPLLEALCFQTLAEQLLAKIHDPSWVTNRGRNPDSEHHELIKRLLDAGASAGDLAVFARVMQRQYLSDLGCLLDGAGIYGMPEVPFETFRIFAVDGDNKPTAMIDELHASLEFQDIETEMELSRKASGNSNDAG